MKITKHSLRGAYNPYRYILKKAYSEQSNKEQSNKWIFYKNSLLYFTDNFVYVMKKIESETKEDNVHE